MPLTPAELEAIARLAPTPQVGLVRRVVDVETRSELDLETVGADRYARDPSTDIVCLSISRPGSEPIKFGVEHGLHWRSSFVEALGFLPSFTMEHWRTVLWLAYNAPFDSAICEHILHRRYGWPRMVEWECLMQRAAYYNLPGGLDGVAEVLGTPRKDPAGHALMLKMCKPARAIRASSDPWRLHTPENRTALALYCQQDVRAEEPLDEKLPKLPECEIPVVKADRAMNQRGIRVDLERVEQIRAIATEYGQHLREKLRSITHGEVESETKLPALKLWLRNNGLPLFDGPGGLDKYAIDAFLDGEGYDGQPLAQPLSEPVREVLSIRKLLGKASLAKLDSLRQATDPIDFRVRGMFQYYGADRSGRWAGRIIQPQNLPKGVLVGPGAYEVALSCLRQGDVALMEMIYGAETLRDSKVMDVLASMLRTCLVASPSHRLYVVDYNAIECRMAAWFAGEEWLLAAFREGRDPYKQMAGWIYNCQPEQVSKPQRDDGKLAELSCQYGLGWKSMKKQAKQKAKRILSDEESKHIVDTYRRTHPRIKAKWYALEEAAHNATRNPGTIYGCGQVAFKHDGVHLKLRLPVGRIIHFHQARIDMLQPPWDTDELRPVLTYMAEDSTTHQWRRQTAWGGDFMAISCQGMARDLIAGALVRLEREHWHPVLTVHDEVGCDESNGELETMSQIMCASDPWAAGLPVKAEGFIGDFYRK